MTGGLLEREEHLRAGQVALRRALDGDGGVLIYEGPAGIGKSAVLSLVERSGAHKGFLVAHARPRELERSFVFGVVRRLFDALLQPGDDHRLDGPAAAVRRLMADVDEPTGSTATVTQVTLHGLLWTLREAADRRPVLLSIDDAQWADEASVTWVRYAAARMSHAPVAILLATRPVPSLACTALSGLLADGERVGRCRIPPLSQAAVTLMLAAALGGEAAGTRSATALQATGGNPFLLAELIRAWRARPDFTAPLSSDRLRRALSHRIAEAGPAARPLVQAIAVLGGDRVRLSDAAALAGLSCDEAAGIADELARMEVLNTAVPLGFVHALVGETIYESVGRVRVGRLHRTAAGRLAATGADDDDVVAHLLAAGPADDPWVVEVLRRAADRAVRRGALREAVTLLRRAAEERPAPTDRSAVLYELGRAEALAGDPAAERDLRAALARSTGAQVSRVALALARLLVQAGHGREAQDLLQRARSAVPDGDEEILLRIEAEEFAAARAESGASVPRFRDLTDERPELRGATAAERLLLASLVTEATCAGLHTDLVDSLAERAFAEGKLIAEEGAESLVVFFAIASLGCRDRHGWALELLDAVLAEAARTGSIAGHAMARAWRADVLRRAGATAEAEADATGALALSAEHEVAVVAPLALHPLVTLLVDDDRLDAAAGLLAAAHLEGPMPSAGLFGGVQHARGRLRLAQGRTAEALADFLAAGDMLRASHVVTPAIVPWRSDAALALAALGEDARGRALAEEELMLARRLASPGALGLALRAHALVTGGATRQGGLAAAVAALRRASSPVELSRALLDLGLQRVRQGEREAGRASLREALDLAARHGARRLATRAETELRVAGGRPRRRRTTGRDSLTAAELRVAELAVVGRSNREIAAELFLTRKTVESHLSHVYLKLSVAGRSGLGTALASVLTTPEPRLPPAR